jgi:16S rRNA (cytosine1402-N4)-methyltransferase
MTDPLPEKPPRRPRYRGKNPRGFAEKYKELQPERYPDDVAKVLAGGKTPAGTHRPIMVAEILDVLALKAGEVVVDCTLGYGGHARELLAAVQPGGRLIALDADPIERPKAEARLRALGFPAESLVVRASNFAELAAVIGVEAPGGADVILADLGLSSMQIDDPTRGFGFKIDGPLDMRMDPSRGEPASAVLSRLDKHTLAGLLEANADEPESEGLALAILTAHRKSPITTTGLLATAIRAAYPRLSSGSADDAVRRAFQALRIEVNGEFSALDTFLRDLPRCLKPGGRVAILTFHSGEDRRVKAAFKAGLVDGSYASISRDVTRASPEEMRDNPRSSSAKLRYATVA